jgi:hypothetical protein
MILRTQFILSEDTICTEIDLEYPLGQCQSLNLPANTLMKHLDIGYVVFENKSREENLHSNQEANLLHFHIFLSERRTMDNLGFLLYKNR